MAVDAEGLAREGSDCGCDDLLHFEGQRAAVGLAKITESAPASTAAPEAHGASRGLLEAVEVVLGIEHHMPASRLQVRHRLADHAQVLFERRLQRALHLGVHVFPTIVTTGAPHAMRSANPGSSAAATPFGQVEPKAAIWACFKSITATSRKKATSWGSTQEAALDVVDAELVETPHDGELVGQRA